jgi:hypothetical protein
VVGDQQSAKAKAIYAKNLIVPWEDVVKMSYFAIEFPNAAG